MICRMFVTLTALFALISAASAAPVLTISGGGLQGGNWVWNVSISPDLTLASSTPLAEEIGFRLTSSPLLSATNINPAEFNPANPGKIIFGWETLDPTANNNPVGLQVNLATSEIFSAFGTIDFTTPGPKPFLQILARGPNNGGSASSTIEWLGAYGGKGRIAQATGQTTAANFDLYSGISTQVPEPTSVSILVLGSIGLVSGFAARRKR